MSDAEAQDGDPPLMRLVSARKLGAGPAEQLVYRVDGSWFFLTSDGLDLGPYGSRGQATGVANALAELLGSVDDPAERMALSVQVKYGDIQIRNVV